MISGSKFVLLMLFLPGCARGGSANRVDSTGVGVVSRTIADDPSAIIDQQRGMVLGLQVGITPDSVKKILGSPIREGSDLSDSTVVTVLEFPMGTVRSRGDLGLIDFLCGGDECQTVDKVGVGDSSNVVLGTYGPTPPRGPLEAPEALDYRLGSSNCNLTFTLSTGRVTSLELGCTVR